MTESIWGTKAETLEKIKPLIRESQILDIILFSIENWMSKRGEILQKIQSLNSNLLIVRSSAINEDHKDNSMAGSYCSIPNVNKNDIYELTKAIESVKESYLKDHYYNPKDQVLVQPMLKEVEMSGVLFTRCNLTGAPYYIVNYEDASKETGGVTSGNLSNLKTFTFFKYLKKFPNNKSLEKIIRSAQEIEKITGTDSLDIEFAIKNGQVFILQIRPLTTIKTNPELDKKLEDSIENIKTFINSTDKKFPNLFGYKTLFGSMPDWNPAEIIGDSPKPLAFSLYRELVTDYIWPFSRKEIGYKDVGYHPGVVSIGGKPYVDVRLSFNTFIPGKLSDTTSEKLVNFYIDKLINNPEMHDKIEFKIAYTCYPFGFLDEEKELVQNNFSSLQIKEIKESLIKLTNDIIQEKVTSIDKENELINSLEEKRNKIKNSEINTNVKISQLIYDCKYYGTLPFSKLARFAFIGNILLNSLVKTNAIEERDKNNLLRSINSVATDFLKKINGLKRGSLTKEEFLSEFGHLRPGTYDLCSKTYRECFDEYFNLVEFEEDLIEPIQFILPEEKKKRIRELIIQNGFEFSVEQFFNFARRALVAREKSKFEFTKNLSLILDYCYEHMKKYGFTKEDTTFLEISDILSTSYKSPSLDEINYLKEKIRKNKEGYEITKALRLPPLVYMEKNAEYFHQFDNKPNYITNKTVVGEVVYLTENMKSSELNKKIVLITSADPGYDWIFGHNISGLITKYGGVASHMSIRCAELGIPAAIGCGETIFTYIQNFKKIELNCMANQIKGIL